MSLQEILTEIGDEKAKVVNDAIAAAALVEKNKGVEASKKKGAENTKLIDRIAKVQNTIKSVLDIDDLGDFGDEQIENLKEKLTELKTKKPDGGGNGDNKIFEAMMKKQMADLKTSLEKKIEEKEAEANSARAKFQNAKITNKLTEAMKDKFKGHDVLVENWILKGKVKLDENENVVFIGDSDDETIDQKKYLESFAKDRSDLVVSNQIPGGGSAGGGNRDITKVKQISMDQFAQLSLDDQLAFKKAGGNFVDT